jgi:hypothetical protein
MDDNLIRFLIGGTVVTLFSVIGDIFRPKSFAGLFGAAPSIALATIGLTIKENGKAYVSVEARSMLFGAIAFLFYSVIVSWVLLRFKPNTLVVTVGLMPIWFGLSLCLWSLMVRLL